MTSSEMTHDHTTRCWWNPHEARWQCRPDQAPPETPLVDVRDMIVVHTALLREFRLAPAAVRRTAEGDRRQAAAVAAHLRFVGELLHHHHTGEDTYLWPLLRSRVTAAGAELLDDVEAQHAGIDAVLDRATELRQAWTDVPGPDRREQFAAELEKLHAALQEHLDLEERCVLPLAASLLTESEWRALGESAVAAMPKSALALTFGMFSYEGDSAVLRDMLASAPPPVRVLMPRLAPRVYARRARQVHGTARP